FAAGAPRGGRRGRDAVLEPRAIIGEMREDLAVVHFHGVEIGVGDRQHALSAAALLGRQDLVELRIVHHLRYVAERRRQRCAAMDHALDLVDLAVSYPNAHGVDRGLAVLHHRTEPGGIAGTRIGSLQTDFDDPGQRAPDAFAHRLAHAVLCDAHTHRLRT